jgi:hypothetical protein
MEDTPGATRKIAKLEKMSGIGHRLPEGYDFDTLEGYAHGFLHPKIADSNGDWQTRFARID